MNESSPAPPAPRAPPAAPATQSASALQSPDAPARDHSAINRLLLFFAIVYVVEGLGQVGGLIAQPLSFYLKQVQGWTPSEVSAYLTIFNFPWIIKPVYGVFSDFVPLFGYRRKGYLIAANLVATGAFLCVTQLHSPNHLVWALEITAYAMAISSTVCGAVLVENAQKLGESGRFVNQQWLWFNVAAMVSALGGGALTHWLAPASALHAAAAIVAVAPLAVLFGAIFLIPEQPARIDLPALRRSFRSLLAAFKKRELWIVGMFLFLYYFSPGLSTPLYYTMTDSLKFSQGYIGILGSISSAGWVVGALLYRRLFGDLSSKRLLQLSIVLGTLTTAAYLLLGNEISAAILTFGSGFAAMLATVATITLAADYSPQRAEGFSFAVMMSLMNLASSSADNIGSLLFEHVFHNKLAPLILVSAACTAFAFMLIPLLHLGDKPQGQPVGADAGLM
jgi:MFS family permease